MTVKENSQIQDEVINNIEASFDQTEVENVVIEENHSESTAVEQNTVAADNNPDNTSTEQDTVDENNGKNTSEKEVVQDDNSNDSQSNSNDDSSSKDQSPTQAMVSNVFVNYENVEMGQKELVESYNLLNNLINFGSPELEYEADLEAVKYLHELGYHPRALKSYLNIVDIFERLKGNKRSAGLSFGRHPKTVKRINKMEKYIVKNKYLLTGSKNLNVSNYLVNVKKHKQLNYSAKITKVLDYIYSKNTEIEYQDVQVLNNISKKR